MATKILVIEDSDLLDNIVEILDLIGLPPEQIVACATAEEALSTKTVQALNEADHVICLLDRDMGSATGPQVLASLLNMPEIAGKFTEVISISGNELMKAELMSVISGREIKVRMLGKNVTVQALKDIAAPILNTELAEKGRGK